MIEKAKVIKGKGHLPIWFVRLFCLGGEKDLAGVHTNSETGEKFVYVVRFDMKER